MKDAGAILCALLKARKEDLDEIMGDIEIKTLLDGKMRLGDTESFRWNREWNPTLKPVCGYFCHAPQCNGGRYVPVKNVIKTFRRELVKSVGGIDPFRHTFRLAEYPLFGQPRFSGRTPFHPRQWNHDLLSLDQLRKLEDSRERMLRKIAEAGVPPTVEIMIGSYEQLLLQSVFFGDQKMIGELRTAMSSFGSPYQERDDKLNAADNAAAIIIERGIIEFRNELTIISELRKFYDDGNIPLGLNAENTMLLLYQD